MPGIAESKEFIPVHIAVMTVSDTRTEADDRSGTTLVELLQRDGHKLAAKVMKKYAKYLQGGRVALVPLAKRRNRVLYRARILGLGKAGAYRACRVLESHQRDCMELKLPAPIELASR